MRAAYAAGIELLRALWREPTQLLRAIRMGQAASEQADAVATIPASRTGADV